MIYSMSKLRPDEIKLIKRKSAQGCGVRQIAYDVNRAPSTVSDLLNGRTHADPKPCKITVEQLQLQHTDDPCPRCDVLQGLKTIRNICPVCDLKDFERRGLAEYEAK